jgi:hypothetical protein
MMTQRDFRELAYQLRDVRLDIDSRKFESVTWEAEERVFMACVEAIIKASKISNSRFREDTFMAAIEAETLTPGLHGR